MASNAEPIPENRPVVPTGMTPALYTIFFLSGAAALIYEISWMRQIGLLFGHTVQAGAIVLGSYFTGLAVGYHVGGRWLRSLSPLSAYASAELVAASWACLVPIALSLSHMSPFVDLLQHSTHSLQLAARSVFCFLLMMPATIALGATLPFMARCVSSCGYSNPGRVAFAYAFNTAGAVFGVLSCAFCLIASVGVRGSSLLAAGLSAACAGLAMLVSIRMPAAANAGHASTTKSIGRPQSPLVETDQTSSNEMYWLTFAAASGGFATLALEVLYMRMFSLVFHNSTYTFAAVVALFLTGLSLGAMLVRPLSRRMGSTTLLMAAASIGAITIVLSVSLFVWLTGLEYFAFGESFAEYLAGAFGIVAIVVLVPATILGTILPAIWMTTHVNDQDVGRIVGRYTMINTLAAAAGAVSACFLFLPTFGLWGSFTVRRPAAGIVGLLRLLASASQIHDGGCRSDFFCSRRSDCDGPRSRAMVASLVT